MLTQQDEKTIGVVIAEVIRETLHPQIDRLEQKVDKLLAILTHKKFA